MLENLHIFILNQNSYLIPSIILNDRLLCWETKTPLTIEQIKDEKLIFPGIDCHYYTAHFGRLCRKS